LGRTPRRSSRCSSGRRRRSCWRRRRPDSEKRSSDSTRLLPHDFRKRRSAARRRCRAASKRPAEAQKRPAGWPWSWSNGAHTPRQLGRSSAPKRSCRQREPAFCFPLGRPGAAPATLEQALRMPRRQAQSIMGFCAKSIPAEDEAA
ncbi:unnamed protein product, partial [Polarella glacialis]